MGNSPVVMMTVKTEILRISRGISAIGMLNLMAQDVHCGGGSQVRMEIPSVLNAAAVTSTLAKTTQDGLMMKTLAAIGMKTMNLLDAQFGVSFPALTASLLGKPAATVSAKTRLVGQTRMVTRASGTKLMNRLDAPHGGTTQVAILMASLLLRLVAIAPIISTNCRDVGHDLVVRSVSSSVVVLASKCCLVMPNQCCQYF